MKIHNSFSKRVQADHALSIVEDLMMCLTEEWSAVESATAAAEAEDALVAGG